MAVRYGIQLPAEYIQVANVRNALICNKTHIFKPTL